MPASRRVSNMLAPAMFFIVLCAGSAWALDLQAMIRNVEKQYTGASSQATMRMRVKTANWDRTMEMEAWSVGRQHFLARILQPAKDRGVATLKAERDIWNYLPRVDRIIKVPPSMMGGAWMGSHITNDDLVKASHIDRDFTFSLLEENEEHYLVECLPKPDAAVVWGKIIYQILKPHLVPGVIAYYDEDMVKVRDIRFTDVRQIGDRYIPMRMSVFPVDKPDEQTLMEYTQITFDVPIDLSFFTLRNLKSR